MPLFVPHRCPKCFESVTLIQPQHKGRTLSEHHPGAIELGMFEIRHQAAGFDRPKHPCFRRGWVRKPPALVLLEGGTLEVGPGMPGHRVPSAPVPDG